MQELANTIQKVINTLQDLDIKSTYDNMNRLLGCQETLANVRDRLMESKPIDEQPNDNV